MSARLTAFFALVVLLTIPFWFLGASDVQLMPGLPISALAVICPSLVAALLTWRDGGSVRALFARAWDWRRIPSLFWYVALLLTMPALSFFAYGIMRLMGLPLSHPVFPSLPADILLFLVFIVAAELEEIGWSGYALEPLEQRLGVLGAALLLGGTWAAWHFIPLVQAHRDVGWIAYWTVATVATRVIMVWLYDHAGRSVFAMALFHAMNNLCWQLFPNRGSHYDPRIMGALLAILAVGLLAFGRLYGKPEAKRA